MYFNETNAAGSLTHEKDIWNNISSTIKFVIVVFVLQLNVLNVQLQSSKFSIWKCVVFSENNIPLIKMGAAIAVWTMDLKVCIWHHISNVYTLAYYSQIQKSYCCKSKWESGQFVTWDVNEIKTSHWSTVFTVLWVFLEPKLDLLVSLAHNASIDKEEAMFNSFYLNNVPFQHLRCYNNRFLTSKL